MFIKKRVVFRLTMRKAIMPTINNVKIIPGRGCVPIKEDRMPYRGIGSRSKYKEKWFLSLRNALVHTNKRVIIIRNIVPGPVPLNCLKNIYPINQILYQFCNTSFRMKFAWHSCKIRPAPFSWILPMNLLQ
jgi:hypothetical protein